MRKKEIQGYDGKDKRLYDSKKHLNSFQLYVFQVLEIDTASFGMNLCKNILAK